jgi:hypothetical protein
MYRKYNQFDVIYLQNPRCGSSLHERVPLNLGSNGKKSVGIKPMKEEVSQAIRVASSCIHIEQIMRRCREFEFLKPYATINNILLYTDDKICIACAVMY